MAATDLVCFSHLRWDFVYQRPNHLMARAARTRRVFFVEEPVQVSGNPANGDGESYEPQIREVDGLTVIKPVLPETDDDPESQLTNVVRLRAQMTSLFRHFGIESPWLWYYTPLSLRWTSHLPSAAIVYDCMDELSAFKNAPAEIQSEERRLVEHADVVFTGGRTLYESKRALHRRTHLFPSSVDRELFGRARQPQRDPDDQALIDHPRVGYFGVIDERLDLGLVADVADARPQWQVVMVGPIAKLEPTDLPKRPNIHWLGQKRYTELPAYLAGWDVALMPFALNEATRNISPTKTPEYLSGGRPVVSTPIRDVVDPYGRAGLVEIARGSKAFVAGIEAALKRDRAELTAKADQLLAAQSWDDTWSQMEAVIRASERPSRTQLTHAEKFAAQSPALRSGRVASSRPQPSRAQLR